MKMNKNLIALLFVLVAGCSEQNSTDIFSNPSARLCSKSNNTIDYIIRYNLEKNELPSRQLLKEKILCDDLKISKININLQEWCVVSLSIQAGLFGKQKITSDIYFIPDHVSAFGTRAILDSMHGFYINNKRFPINKIEFLDFIRRTSAFTKSKYFIDWEKHSLYKQNKESATVIYKQFNYTFTPRSILLDTMGLSGINPKWINEISDKSSN